MSRENISQDALTQADRTSNEFSGYRGALGQAGVQDIAAKITGGEFLTRTGDQVAVSPGPSGFEDIYIGCAWNIRKTKESFWGRLFGLRTSKRVDLDLGVLYELADGTHGALQALGAADGAYDTSPYIVLSHDERSGLKDGDDEYMRVNGKVWEKIKRLLIYVYIYEGAVDWADVAPTVQIHITGQKPLTVHPQMARHNLSVCAVAMMEQTRGGFILSNLTQYFPGQAEMDRAFGFGVTWQDGTKE